MLETWVNLTFEQVVGNLDPTNCTILPSIRDNPERDKIAAILDSIGLSKFCSPKKGAHAVILNTDLGLIVRISPVREQFQTDAATFPIDEILQPLATIVVGETKIQIVPNVLTIENALPRRQNPGLINHREAEAILIALEEGCKKKGVEFFDGKTANIGLITDPKTYRIKGGVIMDLGATRLVSGASVPAPDDFELQKIVWEKFGLKKDFRPLGVLDADKDDLSPLKSLIEVIAQKKMEKAGWAH